MKKGRDAGFSSKRSGNAGSGPPLPDPEQNVCVRNTGECIQQSNRLQCPEREGRKRTRPKAKKKNVIAMKKKTAKGSKS